MSLLVVLVALGIVNAAWLHYLAAIPREKVPPRPRAHLAAMGLGAALAALGLALAASEGALLGAAVPAFLSLGLAAFFVYLLGQAALPDGAITIHVGDALPEFAADGDDGVLHRASEWRGERVLLKFFRGRW
ncbi:MAG: hypothetical protein ABI193_05690 [Minicystis sp.]